MSEFYVGYLPKAPSGIAKRIRVLVVVLFLLAAACAFIFAKVQRTFAPSAFEFGNDVTFEGIIESAPYPALLISRPGNPGENSSFSRYLLVGTGKHGADSDTASFVGKSVRLKGQLIYRDNQTVIQVTPGSLAAMASTAGRPLPMQDLGTVALVGEIVDSKCYFGVMNPGSGKVHRDCAVRCLSGGVPPSFVTNDYHGAPAVFLLTGSDLRKLSKEAFLALAGRPVRITARVFRSGDTLYLETDPTGISPLP